MSVDVKSAQSCAVPGHERIYYIDWLRVLAMFSVFLFHNARFFDSISDWHVKNSTTDMVASYVIGFMSIWMMPLFFILAGASTFYALKVRTGGQFLLERMLRLVIPLVFGVLVIIPPQAYYEAIFHGWVPAGSNLLELYPKFLESLPRLPWYHLWFLAFLFIFSLVALPFFLTNKRTGKSILSRVGVVFSNPWVLLLLPGLLIGAVDTFLYPSGFFGSRDSGGWDILTYLLFYIFGYLMFSNPRVIETVKKRNWIALVIAAVSTVLLVTVFIRTSLDPAGSFGTIPYAVDQLLRGLCSMSWLIVIVNLGARLLNRTNRFLVYASDAVLPFYILHQTVIICIGFYVVKWDLAIGLKYLVISTTSFIVIMAIYELLVRRIGVLRFLFGMRGKKKIAAAASPKLQ